MTANTKQLEERFNQALPKINQAPLGKARPVEFNKTQFLKAAQELRKVIQKNDVHDYLTARSVNPIK